MQISDVPFQTTDWTAIEPTEHPGTNGVAYWHKDARKAPAPDGRILARVPGGSLVREGTHPVGARLFIVD